jgi:hypothetical protein
MAYCRFLEADIYVYATKVEDINAICCAACIIMPTVSGELLPRSYYAYNTIEMIDHLRQHEDHGDYFPHHVVTAIMDDDKLNFGSDEDFDY